MPRRNNPKPRRHNNSQADWLETMYERTRREFSAADLQMYTEIEQGVAARKVVAEMEQIQRSPMRRKR